ncbi:hypothetical protein [Aquibacillus kalidii]|uniref:hypothetical protein n=1 Tax=Aquibacillus kalidii TaxID=2762597 RepID=UPI001644A95E|nr:hypothetical protein [Aquibacillus kalidii]
MKKRIMIILTVAIIGFISFNLISTDEASMKTDGLQTNITYIDGSTELVSDMTIEGSLLTSKQLTFQTNFQKDNTIRIKNSASSSIHVTVRNIDGKKLLSEKITGDRDIIFSTSPEPGTIELALTNGKYDVAININGIDQGQ